MMMMMMMMMIMMSFLSIIQMSCSALTYFKSCNVSEMVQDRDIVTTDHSLEMIYRLSNWVISDDLE